MNDKKKRELMMGKIDIMKTLLLSDGSIGGSIDVNWAIKNILGVDKKSYRIYKIKKIFNNDEARKI